jgi:hypothetical protein
VTASTGWGSDHEVRKIDVFLRARNPVFLRAPNISQTFDAFRIEGRYGARATIDGSRREHLTFGPVYRSGVSLTWVGIDDTRYLDPGLYDDVGTVEVQTFGGVSTQTGKWELSVQSSVGGGLIYNRDGLAATGRPELNPFYFRATVDGVARRALGDTRTLAARLFGGYSRGREETAKQRQMYLQGSDPFEQLYHPFLRSRGALLVGEDFNYHSPGGAGVRGIDRQASTGAVIALNLELDQTVLARPTARLFSRIGVAAFGDLAHTFEATGATVSSGFLGDAGIGIRAGHRIGDTRFTTRFDVPLYVSRPGLSVRPGDDDFDFRWVFSFEPAF